MRVKVLKDFVNRKGNLLCAGNFYDLNENTKFYKTLLSEKFIEEIKQIWHPKNVTRSKLANVEIALDDYFEGDKTHFTWDETMAIQKNLNNCWRLPTRSEWALICEEFGQKDGRLDAETLTNSLGLKYGGYLDSGKLNSAGNNGLYWSSTPTSNGTNAYNLNFNSSYVVPSFSNYRFFGFSVRLVREMEGKDE